jgi:hypothetical protein
MCRLLRGHGITHLTPELLRLAKFGAPEVCLLRAPALRRVVACA